MGSTSITIELPDDAADIARRRVDSGLSSSVSDAVADGLRLLDENDDDHAARLGRIRDRLERSAASERISSDDVRRHFDRLLEMAELGKRR